MVPPILTNIDRKVIHWFTAILINVVGSQLHAYATRPKGGLGIHWNLHLCVDENYNFVHEDTVWPAWMCLLSVVIFCS